MSSKHIKDIKDINEEPLQEEVDDIINEEIISELEDNKRLQGKKNKKLTNKVRARNITIGVLIIIIILLLLKSCSRGNEPSKKPIETADYIGREIKDDKHVDNTTAIPVISNFTVTKDYPYATLFNPKSNKGYSYLLYKFTDAKSGVVIYESNLVEAGKKFSVDFGNKLSAGKHKVSVDILAFDYKDTSIQKNGGHSDITITVKK